MDDKGDFLYALTSNLFLFFGLHLMKEWLQIFNALYASLVMPLAARKKRVKCQRLNHKDIFCWLTKPRIQKSVPVTSGGLILLCDGQ